MALGARIARLERGLPVPGGPCACPGSVEVVWATERDGTPLPLPPTKICVRCGGCVTRCVVRYEPRPIDALGSLTRWPPGMPAG